MILMKMRRTKEAQTVDAARILTNMRRTKQKQPPKKIAKGATPKEQSLHTLSTPLDYRQLTKQLQALQALQKHLNHSC